LTEVFIIISIVSFVVNTAISIYYFIKKKKHNIYPDEPRIKVLNFNNIKKDILEFENKLKKAE
jgi:hypothetical protein